MNLQDVLDDAVARAAQINDEITALQKRISDLQSEHATHAADIAQIQAFLAANPRKP